MEIGKSKYLGKTKKWKIGKYLKRFSQLNI
jgi:hypothetical protein